MDSSAQLSLNASTSSRSKERSGKFSLQNRRPDLDIDLISNLPTDVYNAILLCLPIKEAVRTSVLSRKWRYRWASIPHLVFKNLGKEVVNIVNGVLLVHKGPIHKFVFSYFYKEVCQISHHIDHWILFLSNRGIKQLTIGPFDYYGLYLVHSCLFSCQELSDLELSRCEIKPPPAFEGFRCLRNLKLVEVSIDNDELEQLISKCPLLETLTLEYLDNLIRFKINAPNLCYLCLGTGELSDNEAEHLELGGVCNLIMVLGSLHHIEKLELHGCSLQFFSISNVPDVLPNPLLHLKNLSMNVSFDAWKEVFTTLCMLRSSPNLEKLEFEDIYERRGEPDTYPTAVFWEAQEHLGCSLNHLRTVKMCRNIDEESALCFIRFILVNAPVLETMSFVGMAGNSRFLMDLLQLRRASPQAIIRCK